MSLEVGSRSFDASTAIQERLEVSSYAEVRRLTCTQQGGALVLTGRVSSYYQKQVAQETAREFAGELSIVNALEVAATPAPCSAETAASAARRSLPETPPVATTSTIGRMA